MLPLATVQHSVTANIVCIAVIMASNFVFSVLLSVLYPQVVQSMLMPAVDFRDTESSEFQVCTCTDPSTVYDQPIKEDCITVLQWINSFKTLKYIWIPL